MSRAVFSDKDIQEYLDGTFKGDSKALLDYLYHTEEGQQRLAFYKQLYNTLQDAPLPELSFSLDDAVLHALVTRTQKKASNHSGLLWIPAGIAALAVIAWCFTQVKGFAFVTTVVQNSLFAGLLVIVVLLVVALHSIDWRQQQERYKKILGV